MYLVAIINTLNANNITAASINLCTDQYLYLIANKNQITSLSYMSKDKNISFISDKILDIKLNNGRAEEIIRQDPDIIFAGLGSSIATVSLLQKLNYKVVNISDAKNFKQIKEQVYLIAKLLHREKKGLELVNKIDNEIKKFFNYSKRKENKKVIIISPNGYVTGEDTLVGGILKEIGYTNVTSNLNISSYGRISLEQILYSDPEVVIIEDSYSDSVSLSQEFLNHSVIKYIVKKGEVLNLNKKLMNCSGPYSTKIIKELIK
ncbi:MAG: Vitamin B12-binding protein [Alphaproteobacteria bacterium MarineAlpha2_Bin1]|nr:MAG: Vitamin B12-binding protein [Alphaproteobacteria bacterium MarineAlpha2_Bin1]